MFGGLLPSPKLGCENDVVLEYGYASRSFLEACVRAWTAVSRVGRGMSGNSADFNDGCVLSNEVNKGKSACVGRLAVNHVHQKRL